jgi:hypothetical protein
VVESTFNGTFVGGREQERRRTDTVCVWGGRVARLTTLTPFLTFFLREKQGLSYPVFPPLVLIPLIVPPRSFDFTRFFVIVF